MRFDRVMGRNTLSRPDRFPETCQVFADRLLPGGRLVLSQPIPRHTQRLYNLIEWGRDAELRDKVIAAEEAIYADPADPMTNWDERDLTVALEAAGLSDIRLTVEEQTEERLITAAHLDRWFGAGAEDGRPSYRERLAAGGVAPDETEKIERLFRNQLLDRAVDWQSRPAYIRAEKSDED